MSCNLDRFDSLKRLRSRVDAAFRCDLLTQNEYFIVNQVLGRAIDRCLDEASDFECTEISSDILRSINEKKEA